MIQSLKNLHYLQRFKMSDVQPQLLSISCGGFLSNSDPTAPTTLVEVLQKAADPDKGEYLTFLTSYADVTTHSYKNLLENASRILAGLKDLGLPPHGKVILLLEDNRNILAAFWGCILGGFIPILVEVPPIGQLANLALEKIINLQKIFSNPLIIISQQRHDLITVLSEKSSSTPQFAIFENLNHYPQDISYYNPQPDDLAFIVLSSGSTGIPKCIQLTHRNLLARAKGANALNHHQPDDIVLNWLPFDHIGSISDWHIRCLLLGCKAIYVQKEFILGCILNWLDLINTFRVTHSWAPCFAYNLINDQLRQNSEQSWDLSCVSSLLTAGEMINFQVMQSLQEALSTYGLKETAIRSAFGMAELASGVTYSRPADGKLTFHKVPSSMGNDAFVDLGVPIPGITLRIVDERNQILPCESVGYLQVKGDAVFKGYYQPQEANEGDFLVDGWFPTGDLGFLTTHGHLVLTGRAKDIITLNGINYYSHEIEMIVEQVPGVNLSYTAVSIVRDLDNRDEKLAIFFNSSLVNKEELAKLIKTIRSQVVTLVGLNPDYLIPLPTSAIPKTSIGKIQRKKLKEKFEAGEFKSALAAIEDLLLVKQSHKTQRQIESQVAKLWKKLLVKGETFNLQDNFFELGGNSFTLVQAQLLLEEQLGYKLPITDLFRYPTVASLAKYLCQKQQKEIIVKNPILKSPEVAVIGMACRFPGADNIEEFWHNLANGIESITFFDEEEILASGIEKELVKNPNYVKANSIISNIENFDADFFGYTPKEAQLIDPQQRILLECAWESLENAGYNPFNHAGAIGFYAATGMNTYLLNNIYDNRHLLYPDDSLGVIDLDSWGGFQMMIANDKDYLTTRVSYKLNLKGPSVNVQTACSSSLTAIHVAVGSLLNGECQLAIAGGVSVQVPQKIGYLYREGMILSPDGHCRAFDAQAKGTIFGNGVGLVVLKELEAAIKDGDHIYAVIKGSAISNDGGDKVNYLAPNGEGQARAIAEAISRSGINAENITYVEAHGTGTQLGDPIEVEALTQAFRQTTDKTGYCAIGSVKTNVGHLQITSGVAGFIKTVLALYHKKIPPSLHFEQPNPQIDFQNSPFYVNRVLLDWSTNNYLRTAGVNSLGIGGTNVHIILEEAPQEPIDTNDQKPSLEILTLSAKSEKALQELIDKYQDYLNNHPDRNWGDICFTANTGRTQMKHRGYIVASSISEAKKQLELISTSTPPKTDKQNPQIVFIFGDQTGEQLGYELYQTQALFRNTIEKCEAILQTYEVEYSFLQSCTSNNQLTTFLIQYGLFSLWESWGIEPNAVLGEGIGEYVAACVSGIINLEDALKLIIYSQEAVTEISYSSDLQVNIISSLTGEWANEDMFLPTYWSEQASKSPRLTEGFNTLQRAGYNIFIEFSSVSISKESKQKILALKEVLWISSSDSYRSVLQSLGMLFTRGLDIKFTKTREHHHRLKLPTYPFQRQRYWIEPPSLKPREYNSKHPLLGRKIASASSEIIFQSSLGLSSHTWLGHHQVNQAPILPGSAYLEMALAAGIKVLKSKAVSLEDCSFVSPLALHDTLSTTVQVILQKNSQGVSFAIYSLIPEMEEDTWILHCSGKVVNRQPQHKSNSLNALKAKCTEKIAAKTFYQNCQERGLEYGSSFQGIQQIWSTEGMALGQIDFKEELLREELLIYQIHPRLLDACFQVLLAALESQEKSVAYVPISLDRLTLYRPWQPVLWSYAQLHFPDSLATDIQIFDVDGNLVAEIEGLTSRKLEKFTSDSLITPTNFKLTLANKGTIDNLVWQPSSRCQPGFKEVEIKVKETGLNFRDLLNALAIYPMEEELGLECVGEIVALGQEVKNLKIGQPVMAVATGSFSQYVTVNSLNVVPIPEIMTYEEAATIPGAFLTAYHTLIRLAKLQPGERVLIESAAGGIGLAAIQIAQKIGAEIWAMASPSKWSFLQEMGIKHILNSRTLTFAEEVIESTQGKGCDVVLNCLSEEYIPKALSILSKNGRFVEIGKKDIWTPEQVSEFRPDVLYTCFDLLSLVQSEPNLIQSSLHELMEAFKRKELHPLPYQIFARENVKEAFRLLQQSKHIGKIVVSMTGNGVGEAENKSGQIIGITRDELPTYVLTQVVKVLGLNSSDNIPLDCPFFDLGLDSLTSIELRNQLQKELNCSLPSTLVFDYSTVNELVNYVSEQLFPSIPSDLKPSITTKLDILQDLTEEEARALLLEELNNLEL